MFFLWNAAPPGNCPAQVDPPRAGKKGVASKWSPPPPCRFPEHSALSLGTKAPFRSAPNCPCFPCRTAPPPLPVRRAFAPFPSNQSTRLAPPLWRSTVSTQPPVPQSRGKLYRRSDLPVLFGRARVPCTDRPLAWQNEPAIDWGESPSMTGPPSPVFLCFVL